MNKKPEHDLEALTLYARPLAAAHRQLADIYELVAKHSEGLTREARTIRQRNGKPTDINRVRGAFAERPGEVLDFVQVRRAAGLPKRKDTSLRGTLNRLVDHGEVERVGVGKYMANPGQAAQLASKL